MRRTSYLLSLALGLALSAPLAFSAPADNTASSYKPTTGQSVNGVVLQQSDNGYNSIPINSAHPLPVTGVISGGSITVEPATASAEYQSGTVGAVSAQLIATESRQYLDIINQGTVSIACSLGGTAVVGGAGSIDIPPGWHRSWDASFVPSDAVNCISSSGTVNVTFASY